MIFSVRYVMKEILIINGGNTHVECCILPAEEQNGKDIFQIADKEKLVFTVREFPEKYDSLAENRFAAGSSVVPSFADFLRSKGVFLISREGNLPFRTDCLDISTVGADRMANAAALLSGTLPAVCIDFGTAITFEVVEEDGNFTGGAILPGRQLMRHALHDHTAQLPLVPLTDSPVSLPQKAGKNTLEAMQLGTDLACIGAVKEILHLITEDLKKKSPGKKIRICGCGGDCDYFLTALPFIEKTPFLTLEGIYRFWKSNHKIH